MFKSAALLSAALFYTMEIVVAEDRPVVIQGPGSAYSTGQSGGITAGSVYIGKPKRTLNSPQGNALKEHLLLNLPKDSPVNLMALSDVESFEFAREVHAFLVASGFKLEPYGITAAIIAPPPQGVQIQKWGDGIKVIIGEQ